MTDFTKEELEQMLYLCDFYINQNDMVRADNYIIKMKLQSVIDKYCEHETQSYLCRMKIQNLCTKCNEYVDINSDINDLLSFIANQQSEKLKVIE